MTVIGYEMLGQQTTATDKKQWYHLDEDGFPAQSREAVEAQQAAWEVADEEGSWDTKAVGMVDIAELDLLIELRDLHFKRRELMQKVQDEDEQPKPNRETIAALNTAVTDVNVEMTAVVDKLAQLK